MGYKRLYAAIALSAVALMVGACTAGAENLSFKAQLQAASEVPPNDSPATGSAEVTVDTAAKMLNWKVSTENLTGTPTAAHIHGPAPEGTNAPPVIDMSANPETGSSTVTDQQIADFQAGRMYLNIHTAQHPDGEIRGQLTQ